MPKRARWQLFDVAHAPIVSEIERQSDRGAAILATAFLEEQLTECIIASLADKPKVAKKLFQGRGAFAPLAAKIDLGLLLGLYNENIHRQLETIRDIRNKFAHRAKPWSFDTDDVAALCRNLPAPRRKRPPRITDERDDRLAKTDEQAWMFMWLDWIHSGRDTPRNRFLIAVRLLYFQFSLWLYIKKRTGKPPPPWPSSLDKSPPRQTH